MKLGKTVVVVPAYVSSEKAAERLAKHVNALAASERADGVDFCCFATLPQTAKSGRKPTKTSKRFLSRICRAWGLP